MSSALQRHYDAKYGLEAQAPPSRRFVAPSAFPCDRYEACLAALPPRFRGGDVLEIGAGDGLLARSLIAAGLPFRSYTATDLSPARIEGLERSLDDARFRVVPLDIEEPCEGHEDRYDAVVLLALVEHLVDPLRALARVRRMLRPGGFAFVDTPNVAKYTRRLKLLFGRFPSTASLDEGLRTYEGAPVDLHDEGHLHYFTHRSLSRMLVERCGFSRVEKLAYASGPTPLGRRFHYGLARLRPELFGELCVVAYA